MVGNDVKRADEWREILAAKADSGQTVAAFCQERGITEYCYYYWQRRLNGHPRTRRVEGRAPGGEGFVELVPAGSVSAGHVTVRLPHLGGVEVVLAPGFDDATLRKLLPILREGMA